MSEELEYSVLVMVPNYDEHSQALPRLQRMNCRVLQGEWLPLVDYEAQCQLIEKMVGEPVLEIRQQPNGSLWFVTDERVYRPD
jgi:hypothetical protein